MNSLILYWFFLIPKIALDIFPDTIYKSFWVFKIFLEKFVKIMTSHWYSSTIKFFILKLLLSNFFIQKQGYKKDLDWFFSPGSFEIIFML